MYLIHYILVLTKELNEVFLKLIYKWDEDPRASRILRQIFEYVSCKIHGNHRLQRKSSTWGPRRVHSNNNVVAGIQVSLLCENQIELGTPLVT